MRSTPRGSPLRPDSASSMPSTSSRIFCAQAKAASPSAVMFTRRVVRLNSLTPRDSSSMAMRLLTWAGEMPSSVAPATKLERRATVQNSRRSRRKGSLFAKSAF
ncbi:hypothetical protein D3C81_1959530 [compost metagenome]